MRPSASMKPTHPRSGNTEPGQERRPKRLVTAAGLSPRRVSRRGFRFGCWPRVSGSTGRRAVGLPHVRRFVTARAGASIMRRATDGGVRDCGRTRQRAFRPVFVPRRPVKGRRRRHPRHRPRRVQHRRLGAAGCADQRGEHAWEVAARRGMRRIFDVNVYVCAGGSRTVAVAGAVCPVRGADLATRSRTISVAAAGEPLTNPKNGPKSRVAE